MLQQLTLSIIFLFASFMGCAQTDLALKEAQENLDQFNDHFQPEYVEVNFDKDFYFSGDKIWYALFLTNEAHAVSYMSVLAYIEVRDRNDSVIIRQKVRCREGIAHGEIQLPEKLYTGYYKITAFTLWMKNTGGFGYFNKLIPVINPDYPLAQVEKKEISSSVEPNIKKVTRTGPHSMEINIQPGTRGQLTVFNREEIILHRTLDTVSRIPVMFQNSSSHHISLLLTDQEGNVIEEKQIVNENINAELNLSLALNELSPRSIAELSIGLKDRYGNSVRGNVSVSVRSKNSKLNEKNFPAMNSNESRIIRKETFSPLLFRKEMFIYPPTQHTLHPVNFSGRKTMVPYEFVITDDLTEKVLLNSEMKRKVLSAYGITLFYETENDYNLPFNNQYEPGKYADIPRLEDFIKEIIPQIKIRKVKGEKVLRVRNSDNSDRVYFFNGSPLILVDRFIETSDELLKIPVSDIDRIDIIWGMKEINSLGVFSLADNGVVSVTTKSRTRRTESRDELFKNLHIPLKFSLPRPTSKESAVPFLFDPVYWNPVMFVNGLRKLNINISDELGEFIVEVKGFTELGDYISGQIAFKVSPGTN